MPSTSALQSVGKVVELRELSAGPSCQGRENNGKTTDTDKHSWQTAARVEASKRCISRVDAGNHEGKMSLVVGREKRKEVKQEEKTLMEREQLEEGNAALLEGDPLAQDGGANAGRSLGKPQQREESPASFTELVPGDELHGAHAAHDEPTAEEATIQDWLEQQSRPGTTQAMNRC